MQNSISILIATISIGYQKNKKKIKVLNTSLNKKILNLFINEGFLWSYNIYNSKNIIIFLKKFIKNNSLLLRSFVFNKTSKYISKNILLKLVVRYPVSLFVISTKKGIYIDRLCLKLNLLGKLVCKIR
jgi:ribosomal protein S8